MLKEFKEFISRGHAMDLAIGVVMGGAFRSVVDSLVADIILPIVGFLTAGADFSNIVYELKPAVIENGEVIKEAVVINFGNLIETVIKFFLIAFVLFLIVKGLNRLRRLTDSKDAAKEAAEEAAKETKHDEEVLVLQEIRDLLKESKQ